MQKKCHSSLLTQDLQSRAPPAPLNRHSSPASPSCPVSSVHHHSSCSTDPKPVSCNQTLPQPPDLQYATQSVSSAFPAVLSWCVNAAPYCCRSILSWPRYVSLKQKHIFHQPVSFAFRTNVYKAFRVCVMERCGGRNRKLMKDDSLQSEFPAVLHDQGATVLECTQTQETRC